MTALESSLMAALWCALAVVCTCRAQWSVRALGPLHDEQPLGLAAWASRLVWAPHFTRCCLASPCSAILCFPCAPSSSPASELQATREWRKKSLKSPGSRLLQSRRDAHPSQDGSKCVTIITWPWPSTVRHNDGLSNVRSTRFPCQTSNSLSMTSSPCPLPFAA